MKNFLISLILLVPFHSLLAVNYYVSASGNDNNSGTSANQAWRSTGRVAQETSQLDPGDSILFRRGDTFYGSLQLNGVHGTAASPVVIGAYGSGERPVISNLRQLSGWEQSGDNLWFAGSEDPISMVLINNKPAPQGRYPNSGYRTITGVVSRTEFTDNTLPQPDGYWKNASAVIRTNRFVIDNIRIKDQVQHRIILEANTRYLITNNFGYFIQDHLNTLDAYGEWYYDPSAKRLYIWIPDAGNIQNLVIEGSAIDRGISLVNSSQVHIENVQVAGSADCAVYVDDCSAVRIVRSRIYYANRDAISVRGSVNIEVSGCGISNSGANGIIWQENSQGSIINNNITGSGLVPGKGEDNSYNAITLTYGDQNSIAGNTIDSSGYCGIHFLATNNLTIERNFINHSCLIIDDGGGIYASGANYDFQGIKISRNIIMNSIGNIAGTNETQPFPNLYTAGIYLDHKSNNMILDHNTVAGSGLGIYMNNPRHIRTEYNTAFNNYFQLHIRNSDAGNTMNNCSFTGNILASAGSTANRHCLYIKYVRNIFDPSFRNTFEGNYYINAFNNEIITLNNEGVSPATTTRYDFTSTGIFSFDMLAKSTPFSFAFSGIATPQEFIRLKYNPAATVSQESFPEKYRTADNKIITGLTLDPYTSAVVFRDNRLMLSAGSKPGGDSVICAGSKSGLFTTGPGMNNSGQWTISPSHAGVFTPGTGNATLYLNPHFTGEARVAYAYSDQGSIRLTPDKHIAIKSDISSVPMPSGSLDLVQDKYRGVFSVPGHLQGDTYQWFIEPSGIAEIISDKGDTLIISLDAASFSVLSVSVQKQNECGLSAVSEKLVFVNQETNLDSLIKENRKNLDFLLNSDVFADYPDARLMLYTLDGKKIIDCLVIDHSFYVNKGALAGNRMYLFSIHYGGKTISDKYFRRS